MNGGEEDRAKKPSVVILKHLWEKSDEEHPASIADIIGYLNENGIEAHRHTVTAAIEQLWSSVWISFVCEVRRIGILSQTVFWSYRSLSYLWMRWTPRVSSR